MISRKYFMRKREYRKNPRTPEHIKAPELQYCPKCGGKAKEVRGDGNYSVICTVKTCRHSAGRFTTREEAIAAWNREAKTC